MKSVINDKFAFMLPGVKLCDPLRFKILTAIKVIKVFFNYPDNILMQILEYFPNNKMIKTAYIINMAKIGWMNLTSGRQVKI